MDSYDDPAYAAEYWRLDAEARQSFIEVCPAAQGECVSLGDLDALCRLMGRPIRDDTERVRLMTELDTTNQMTVQRHDFVAWLLQDMARERELEDARLYVRANRAVPVAEAAWEEIVISNDAASYGNTEGRVMDTAADPPALSRYYYNVLTGESKWDLPRFVQCLWSHITAVDAKRALTVPDPHEALLLGDDHPFNVETLQDLHALFLQYDDDGSGALDSAEFEDLCVALGLSLSSGSGESSSLPMLMREVDPFSAQEVVTWDAFSYYWTANAPFQRRTRLSAQFAAWERVDTLHKKNLPVAFRNTDTLAERWNHPEMEQNVVALLLKVVPSTKIEWAKKVALFFEAQLDVGSSNSSSTTSSGKSSESDGCGRVLLQLGHPMARKRHLEAAIQRIRERFGGDAAANGNPGELSEDTTTAWLLYCVRKFEMNGWEELVEPTSGQVYYYHEVSGATQWDPPEMETHMTQFLNKFGGGGASSSDERITRIFRHYDLDESGSISFDEFQQFYRALLLGTAGAVAWSPSTPSAPSAGADELKIRQIFAMLDTGGDGSVSLDEFKLWWRTKLQLEEEESADAKLQQRVSQRRELCRAFLEGTDALLAQGPSALSAVDSGSDSPAAEQLVCFASNLLPRLVAVLGKYPLRGLAYRNALNQLVMGTLSQEVRLDDFLAWYDGFEAGEREKEELEEARAKAQAAIQAQELKARARAKEKRLNAKRKHVLAATQPKTQEAMSERIETLFRAFDADGSGFLDSEELQQLTKALGHAMDAGQVRQMMQVIDSSGDGRVTLVEFMTFWAAFQRTRSPVKTATTTSTGASAGSSSGAALASAPDGASLSPSPPVRRSRRSVVDASATLSVNLEMAKTRLLQFSLDDFKDALGDWKDELADKRRAKTKLAAAAAREETRRQSAVFVPTRRRRYGAHIDVTWIEPDVVACVADMIERITRATRPPLRPDAAQTIQKLARGFVTRQCVHRAVDARFAQHVDLHTEHFYYVDRKRGAVLLERPLFRFDRTSSVPPFALEDCDSKRERYEFHKRALEMRAKQRFFESNGFASALGGRSSAPPAERHFWVPAAFYVFDVVQLVRSRLLGDIWVPLRQKRDFALVELIATRHRRQLRQRSSDGAASLPLHFVVRHFGVFPLRVVRAVADGFPDALGQVDAFGMTPLHLALRERHPSEALLRLLTRRAPLPRACASVWEMTTRCGDTPLHTGVLHRAPIELMRWILRRRLIPTRALCVFNARGLSPFHLAIRLLGDAAGVGTSVGGASAGAAYAKALIYAFLKTEDAPRLCALCTKQGDLPLHVAMDAFARASAAGDTTREHLAWVAELLLRRHPATLLVRKAGNGLLPIHLAIKYGFPADVVASVWQATLARIYDTLSAGTDPEASVLDATTIAPTRMTLLHYAALHQPHALELIQSVLSATPAASRLTCAPNDNLPLHLAVSGNSVGRVSSCASSSVAADTSARRCHVIRLLCDQYAAGCQVYNRQGELPLHLALASSQSVEIVQMLLASSPFVLSTNKRERNGLRALVLAASRQRTDYAVLRELVELTPSVKVTASRDAAYSGVTPLFALATRPYHERHADATAPARTDVLTALSAKFEQVEDEDAYFLAMARAKMRRKHHCPTPSWEFHAILRLVDLNPLDEAVTQRSLLAISHKLQALAPQQAQRNHQSDERTGASHAESLAAEAAVAAIALDPDLEIVRRVHHVLFEFPSNARVQVVGQRVLRALLPTAFAKAAYKSKIDPYFNL
ncbi:hypothetical protein PybrP1_004932 [[Pythium] brassicae (nom. inval.)]|nr:hypothetical protein PybrP1_004932 [[Pythium] brassicae (nom. inval.)]